MGPGATVDGMAAARKLSASLVSNVKLESPETPSRPFQAAQEAPRALPMPPDDLEPMVTIRVPLRALWAFMKEVSIGE